MPTAVSPSMWGREVEVFQPSGRDPIKGRFAGLACVAEDEWSVLVLTPDGVLVAAAHKLVRVGESGRTDASR